MQVVIFDIFVDGIVSLCLFKHLYTFRIEYRYERTLFKLSFFFNDIVLNFLFHFLVLFFQQNLVSFHKILKFHFTVSLAFFFSVLF